MNNPQPACLRSFLLGGSGSRSVGTCQARPEPNPALAPGIRAVSFARFPAIAIGHLPCLEFACWHGTKRPRMLQSRAGARARLLDRSGAARTHAAHLLSWSQATGQPAPGRRPNSVNLSIARAIFSQCIAEAHVSPSSVYLPPPDRGGGAAASKRGGEGGW